MGQVVKATLRPLYPQERQTQYSWFQTFALIWILHIFFWVFPRRQIVVGRRFGTMYQFHLQRLGVHCTPSLWRWNWYRVPKRRPTTIWRRGNTQKKIYNNILLNVKCIGWCLSFSELKKMHGETLKFITGLCLSIPRVIRKFWEI